MSSSYLEEELRVLTIPEYCRLRGISVRTYYRDKIRGGGPLETKISDLDARREVQAARELIDGNWKPVGAAASKIMERLR
jgi:hypothetical protein